MIYISINSLNENMVAFNRIVMLSMFPILILDFQLSQMNQTLLTKSFHVSVHGIS